MRNLSKILLFFVLLFPYISFAANISSTNKNARFLDGSDLINFNPSNGGATVTSSAVTGYVWGENAGWINLNPTLGGVSNNGSGTLSGYAWGENTGWINFSPANGGVTINCSGDFSGYAWSERKGWIVFNCATDNTCGTLSHKVTTTWTAASCSADDGGGGGGGGPPGGAGPQPQCSDNRDNDLDGLVDRFDHACHVDGNPANENSYSPLINNENARPVINLVGPAEIVLNLGIPFSDPGATASDAEDGDITSKIVSTASLVNSNIVGNYVVIYNVFDSSGLLAVPVVRIVKIVNPNIVIDPEPEEEKNTQPEIILTGPPVITIHEGDDFPEPGFTAIDLEDGDITSIVIISDPPNPDVVGSYIVTYEVTDSGGLTDIVTRIIDVVPKDVIILPPPDDGVVIIPDKKPPFIFPPPEEIPGLKTFPLLGLILGILATILSTFGLGGKVSEIFLLPARIWSWLLSFFGLRKKYRPWGTVYDSVTKQPLDPAYVTLTDQNGKEVATSITDIDGRYGFLAPAGVYTLKAQKTNYVFPSTKLLGKTNDELYQNLYFGEKVELNEKEGIVARNIPMDALSFDWNEYAKKGHKFMHIYSRFDPMITRLSDIFFYLGLVVSIFAFYVLPEPYNTIIFVLYIVMIVLRILGLRPRFNGRAIEAQTGKPLSFAIIRVISPELARFGQSEIAKRVCDAFGRYYLLVPIGRYQIAIEKKNADGSYSHVFTSGIFSARKGIINKTFKV